MVSLVIRARDAVGLFQSVPAPQWDTVPNFSASAGAFSEDVSEFVEAAGLLIFSVSPDSPSSEEDLNNAGLTLNPATGVISGAYDGATTLQMIIRATDAAPAGDDNADWEQRSAGAFYRNNFSTQDDAETIPITNAAGIIASSWDGVVQAREDLLEFDTVRKLSGTGVMRQNLLASDAAVTTSYVGYRIGWDGKGASTKNTSKTKFYLQWQYYIDGTWYDHFFNNSNFGGKIAIIQAPDSSFGSGEVVIRRDFRPGGFVQMYRIPPGQSSLRTELHYSQFSARMLYSFYDTGSPSPVTSLNDAQLRHGPHSNTSDSLGTDADMQHAPRLVRNGWTTFELYVDLENDIVKLWMAPRGEAPVLVMGGMNYPGRTSWFDLPPVGTSDGTAQGQLYSGVQFTAYMNKNQWTGDYDWPAQDTFVCYGEVIASDNPILFPGGHALQFPGTQVPTGWPPTDTTPVPVPGQ